MNDIAKYAFDTVFDEAGNVVTTPPPRPKTRFTQEDVEAALVQGRSEGQASAEAQAAQIAAAALQEIGTQIASLLGQLAADRDQLRADAARLSYETAKSLAGGLIHHDAEQDIQSLIIDCLNGLTGEPCVTIRVPETLADRLGPQIDSMASGAGYAGQVTLEGDAGLHQTDCRLDWLDGGAAFSMAARLDEIETKIASYLQATSATQLDLFQSTTDR